MIKVKGVSGQPAPTGTVSAADGFACGALTGAGRESDGNGHLHRSPPARLLQH